MTLPDHPYVERPPVSIWLRLLAALLCVLAAVAIVIAVVRLVRSEPAGGAFLSTAILVPSFLFIHFSPKVIRYVITSGALVVRDRMMVTFTFERGELTRVERVSRLRRSLPSFRYVGQTDSTVTGVLLVIGHRRRVLISPANPEDFVSRLSHLWDPSVPLSERRITR